MSCSRCGSNAPKYKNQCYCKECSKLQQAKWTINNRQRKADINRAWRKRHAVRRKVMLDCSNVMWRAIRNGTLQRGKSCQHCGFMLDIEAAHTDYSKPLDVIWLCSKCHRSWDAAQPKTKVLG